MTCADLPSLLNVVKMKHIFMCLFFCNKPLILRRNSQGDALADKRYANYDWRAHTL